MSTPDTAKSNAVKSEQLLGVILAGGQSRRMGGGDKFLKKIKDVTILNMVIDRFSPQVPSLIISANGDVERLSAYGLPVVKDPIENYAGPLAGILSAMIWAETHQPEKTHILSVAADTPLFPLNYSEKMLETASALPNDTIILAKSQGRHHPIFGLWPVSLKDDLATNLDNGLRKIRAWTDACNNASIEFDDIEINDHITDPFFNINEPSDFQIFENLVSNHLVD